MTFFEKLLRLVVEYDYQEFVFWFLSENDALTPSIECGDVFVWGCADEEDILEDDLPLLEKCFQDTGGESGSNGAALFCARKRGMRPQGAMYKHFKEEYWPLFDACGPKREVSDFNPIEH